MSSAGVLHLESVNVSYVGLCLLLLLQEPMTSCKLVMAGYMLQRISCIDILLLHI